MTASESARFQQVIFRRRSVRAFTTEQPSRARILALLEAAVHAPTAMHLQPWGFAIVQDRAQLKRYSDRAKAMLLADPGVDRDPVMGPMLRAPGFNIFYDAGSLIVVCHRKPGRFAEADCWLAAQNLMLAADAGGLATCCIGFAVDVLNLPDVKRELGIPADGAAIAPIIVGHARGEVPGVARDPAQVLSWSGAPD